MLITEAGHWVNGDDDITEVHLEQRDDGSYTRICIHSGDVKTTSACGWGIKGQPNLKDDQRALSLDLSYILVDMPPYNYRTGRTEPNLINENGRAVGKKWVYRRQNSLS